MSRIDPAFSRSTLRARICPPAALLILILMLPPPGAAQLLPPMAVDHLIITNGELAGEFSRLAALRQAEGMRSHVVTLDWIASVVPPGVDLPATIRAFIAAAHAEWGVQFVLLGGDTSVIPVRYVRSSFYPYPEYTPVDLYYAGLDGDWNANGNDLWGEPFGPEGPGDEADLEADIALGRAPVRDIAGAARFVDRTIAADQRAAAMRDGVLILAEVLFPSPWSPGQSIILDGAIYGEQLAGMLEEAPASPSITRRYQNNGPYSGSLPLSVEQVVADLDSRQFSLVHHIGHGQCETLRMGDEHFTMADATGLANAPEYFVLTGNHSSMAGYGATCMAEALLDAPAGGAVAYFGLSIPSFPQTTSLYCSVFYSAVFGAEPMRFGTAANLARNHNLANTFTNTVDRWTVLGLAVLGDPALRLGPVPSWADDDPVSIGTGDGSDAVGGLRPAIPPVLAVGEVAPNPFNPRTTVWMDLPRTGGATLAVHDLRGRLVRTLWRGWLEAGRHPVTWDGLDEQGVQAASGVYLVRLTTAEGAMRAVKVTLAK